MYHNEKGYELISKQKMRLLMQSFFIDFCVEHMANDTWPKEQVRAHMEAVVPTLKR